jgi:hypothetical protein
LGGEGADAHATHALWVDPEEHHLCDFWSWYIGSLAAADSCSTDRAAVIKRDIVYRPGVISSGATRGEFSTGGGTGMGVAGK